MEAKDITKTELKKVAKEFNEQMGLEPPILLDLKVSALKEKCIEAAGQIDLEQDEYSDEVWEILGALGCDPREDAGGDSDVKESEEEVQDETDQDETDQDETDQDETDQDETDQDETDQETDALVEEAMEDTLIEDFKAAKKLQDLKLLAGEWECFADLDLDKYKGLTGPRQLRADMLACMPDDVREEIEPKPAEKLVGGGKDKSAPFGRGRSSEESKARNTMIEELIAAGKYTRPQIIEKVLEKFPTTSRSSVQTVLTDSKNEKYNKFPQLAVEDDNKIMSFKKGK